MSSPVCHSGAVRGLSRPRSQVSPVGDPGGPYADSPAGWWGQYGGALDRASGVAYLPGPTHPPSTFHPEDCPNCVPRGINSFGTYGGSGCQCSSSLPPRWHWRFPRRPLPAASDLPPLPNVTELVPHAIRHLGRGGAPNTNTRREIQ
jgi:hypothetical protein